MSFELICDTEAKWLVEWVDKPEIILNEYKIIINDCYTCTE